LSLHKNIATHNGVFHADEITAIALLKVFTNDKYTLTRVPHNTHDFTDYDFIIDIGKRHDGVRFFDHHQYKGGKSSAGLIWDYLGQEIKYKKITRFIKLIDSVDTGEVKPNEFEFSKIISAFNHTDIYSINQERQFQKAVALAVELIHSYKLHDMQYHEAKKCIKNIRYLNEKNSVALLPNFTPFWKSFINAEKTPHIKAVVWEDAKQKNWKVQLVPKTEDSFEFNTNPLPQNSLMTFVHRAGFFAVAPNFETMYQYLKNNL